MAAGWQGPLEKIDDYRWRIPKSYKPGMRVPGIIYADEKLLVNIRMDKAPEQVANAAFLPGIVKYSLAMPDIHWGYGFPIGGVAGFDYDTGVISPGGIGYDINCGVRLLRTNLELSDVSPKLEKLISTLFTNIPSGVGSTGKINLNRNEVMKVLEEGSKWSVKKGFGNQEDLSHTEDQGQMSSADPSKVSQRALERGREQLGTLGAGNHFLEIQVIDEVYDEQAANSMGLFKGQVTIMIHTGSRGLGYQVCDDYIKILQNALKKYNISIPDRQLVCTPVTSDEGKDYFSAMSSAANYAWANRQCITHWTRESFMQVMGMSPKDIGLELVYDVAHNIGKIEEHNVEGKKRKLIVHRKGATRAFPGQPVIIPGSMGTNSYVLVGTQKALDETWGSTCHGAGRTMSRTEALRRVSGGELKQRLAKEGIIVQAREYKTLAEEAPEAYKDVNMVVEVCHQAGISKKVVRMSPVGVIKG